MNEYLCMNQYHQFFCRFSGVFPLLVKLCLCLSLFFTYPVMMFPVVQIIEKRFKHLFASTVAGVSKACETANCYSGKMRNYPKASWVIGYLSERVFRI